MSAVISSGEPASSTDRPSRSRRRPSVGRSFAWLYLAIIVLITIFPFYWMLRTALSNNVGLAHDPSSLLPVGLTAGAFERVLGLQTGAAAQAQGGSGVALNFGLFFRNSVIYATLSTFCQVFFASLAAYAFSRLRWKGRDLVFGIFFCALLIPGIFTLLPNFITVKDLGLLNTFPGLILPGALFSAFNVFFLRQFFLGMSTEIEEAALLDGAGRLRLFFQITLPLAAGPLTTLTILGFINQWNDYFWPLLVGSDPNVAPLTLGVAVFQQSAPNTATDWAGVMAAALIAAVPMLVIFIFFGRRIVNSIGFTGLK